MRPMLPYLQPWNELDPLALQILVLGFCDTQRDLEVVQKILSQVHKPLHHGLHAMLRGHKCSEHMSGAAVHCSSFRLSILQPFLGANSVCRPVMLTHPREGES